MIIGTLDRMLALVCLIYLRISQVLLVLLVGGIFAEVLMRYVLGGAFLGTGELARLSITWIVFLMSVVLYRRKRHIMVTALVDILPRQTKRVLDAITSVAVILLSIYILIQLQGVWEFLSLRTAVLRIPDTAFKIAPAFAFVPIGLQATVDLSKLLYRYDPA